MSFTTTLLLTTTTWPLPVIAHAVGSHLALHMKRLTGLTPNRCAHSTNGGKVRKKRCHPAPTL
ncbi:MAG: hypothetical protein ACRDHW_09105 [Ktedonobacteraceae bacterium]